MTPQIGIGAAGGQVRGFLRLEGLAALAVATSAYFALGGVWWLYALAFFAPDLSFLGYLAGRKAGAWIYNLAHTYAVPAIAGAIGFALGIELVWQLALVHAAHIGFDRALGYGLKYPSAFEHTHLGSIGRNGHKAGD